MRCVRECCCTFLGHWVEMVDFLMLSWSVYELFIIIREGVFFAADCRVFAVVLLLDLLLTVLLLSASLAMSPQRSRAGHIGMFITMTIKGLAAPAIAYCFALRYSCLSFNTQLTHISWVLAVALRCMAGSVNNLVLLTPTASTRAPRIGQGLSDKRIAKIKDVRLQVSEPTEACCICFESYEKRQLVKVLPCKHKFHKLCVVPWLMRKNQCPICRGKAA